MAQNSNRVRFYEAPVTNQDLSKVHSMEREVAGFCLTETSYPPGFNLPMHSHGLASFYLVLRGGFTETYGSSTRECKPSNFVFTPIGEAHSNHFHRTGGTCFIVDIPSHFLDLVCGRAVVADRSVHFQGGLPAWLATRAYKEICQLDHLSPLVIEGLTLEILATLSREKPTEDRKPPRWLRQAKDVLHARFSDKLTLSEISATVGVHPVHLAAVFRRNYRCSIGEYIRRIRIQSACHMIATSNVPLVSIALATGFCDQSHFSRVFTSLVGLTPAEYRETVGLPKRIQDPFD